MTSRYDPSSSQYKDIFHLSPLRVQTDRSPELRPVKISSDFALFEILRENGLLEPAQKVKIMTKEYLIHYILNIFEGYVKQKDPPMTPSSYFLKYLETKKPGTSSLKKIANSVAHSLGCYIQKSPEINFFHEVFSQKKPVIKMIQNYLYCRRVVKTYFQTKEILDDVKLSLHLWTTIVRKIFKDKPGDVIVDRLKEKIVNNNKQKAFDKISIEPYQRDSNLNVMNQASKLEIEAIYLIILCLGEFQTTQTTSLEKSPSPNRSQPNLSQTITTTPPTKHLRQASDSTVKISPAKVVVRNDVPIILIEEQAPKFSYSPNFDIYKKRSGGHSREESREYSLYTHNKSREISPNRSTLTNSSNIQYGQGQNYSREGLAKSRKESQTFLNTSIMPQQEELNPEERAEYDQLWQERVALKKEVAQQTTEKRISTETLLKTVDYYEDLADNEATVYNFLKQTQKDFSILLSKLKTAEPHMFRDVDKSFVEKFLLNRPDELTQEKTKVVSNIKHRFDPKAAYRVQTRKEEASSSERVSVSVEGFRSQVFTPGSKSYIAAQKENIQKDETNNEDGSKSPLSFSNPRKYDPKNLDETQKLLMSLYGNSLANNPQKKTIIAPVEEQKGLREVEIERGNEEKKKSANPNPKYINYQNLSAEKPKKVSLPPEDNGEAQKKETSAANGKSVPIQKVEKPQPVQEKPTEKAQVAEPVVTREKPQVKNEAAPQEIKEVKVEKRETEITIERPSPAKEVEKKNIIKADEKPISPVVSNTNTPVQETKVVKDQISLKQVEKKEEKKEEVAKEKKVENKPEIKQEKTDPEIKVQPILEKQPSESQPEVKHNQNPQLNPSFLNQSGQTSRKNSMASRPQPTQTTTTTTKNEGPSVVEPKPKEEPKVVAQPVQKSNVQPVTQKVETKPAPAQIESTTKTQTQVATSQVNKPEQTKANPQSSTTQQSISKVSIPSTLVQNKAPSKPVTLPPGAVAISGELLSPPQIKIALGIKIVMGAKFDQLLAEKPELAAIHNQIIQEQTQRASQRSKNVGTAKVQVQQQSSKPSQVQQNNQNVISDELPSPPQIKIPLGIKVVMGAKFDQLIAQDSKIAAQHEEILKRKPIRESKPVASSVQVQANKKPQAQSDSSNIIQDELPTPPQIKIPLGIKVVMGAKFDQLLADPKIAALHEQILKRNSEKVKQTTQVQASQNQGNAQKSSANKPAANGNIIEDELPTPPKINIPLGIKVVMGAKFDQLLADPKIAALHEQILERSTEKKQAKPVQVSQSQNNVQKPANKSAANSNIIEDELPTPPKINIPLGIKVVMGAKFDQLLADPKIAALHEQILKRNSEMKKQAKPVQVSQAQSNVQKPANKAANSNIIEDELPTPPKISIPLGIKVVMGAKFDQLLVDPKIAALHEQILKRNSEKVKQATQVQSSQTQSNAQKSSANKPAANNNIIEDELPTPPKISIPLGIKVVMGAKFDQLLADPKIAALHDQILKRNSEKVKQATQIQASQSQNNTQKSANKPAANNNIIEDELPTPPKINIPLGIKIVMGAKFDQLLTDPKIAALHEEILKRKPVKQQKPVQQSQSSAQASQSKAANNGNPNVIQDELPTPPQIKIPLGIKVVMGAKFDQVITDPKIAALHEQILKRNSEKVKLAPQVQASQSNTQKTSANKPAANGNIIEDELPTPPKISIPLGIKVVMGAKFDQLIADPKIAALHEEILKRKPVKQQAKPSQQSQSGAQSSSQQKSAGVNGNLITDELPSPPSINIALAIKVVMGAKFDQLISQDSAIAKLHEDILKRKPQKGGQATTSSNATNSQAQNQAPKSQQNNAAPGVNLIKDTLPPPPKISLNPAIDLVRPGLNAQPKPKPKPQPAPIVEPKIQEPVPQQAQKIEEKKEEEAAPPTQNTTTEAKNEQPGEPPKAGGKFSAPMFKPPVFKKKT